MHKIPSMPVYRIPTGLIPKYRVLLQELTPVEDPLQMDGVLLKY